MAVVPAHDEHAHGVDHLAGLQLRDWVKLHVCRAVVLVPLCGRAGEGRLHKQSASLGVPLAGQQPNDLGLAQVAVQIREEAYLRVHFDLEWLRLARASAEKVAVAVRRHEQVGVNVGFGQLDDHLAGGHARHLASLAREHALLGHEGLLLFGRARGCCRLCFLDLWPAELIRVGLACGRGVGQWLRLHWHALRRRSAVYVGLDGSSEHWNPKVCLVEPLCRPNGRPQCGNGQLVVRRDKVLQQSAKQIARP